MVVKKILARFPQAVDERGCRKTYNFGAPISDEDYFSQKMKRSAFIVTSLPLLAICWIVWHFWGLPWTALRIVGLTTLGVGLILLTLARIQLGNSFSMRPQATQLITHGLYAKVRNPIYLFGLFVFSGVFLYIDQPYLFLILLPVIAMQISRARAEARVLEEKFGDEYRAYRASTWF